MEEEQVGAVSPEDWSRRSLIDSRPLFVSLVAVISCHPLGFGGGGPISANMIVLGTIMVSGLLGGCMAIGVVEEEVVAADHQPRRMTIGTSLLLCVCVTAMTGARLLWS